MFSREEDKDYVVQELIKWIGGVEKPRETLTAPFFGTPFPSTLITGTVTELIFDAVRLCLIDGWNHTPPWLVSLIMLLPTATVDAKLIATGRAIFKDKCQKCHGSSGKGDGPDADPDAQEDMDLTRASRAAKNPDGVIFFKAWNGRKKPKMPAVKDELTKEQLWAVVAYVQTLRKPTTP